MLPRKALESLKAFSGVEMLNITKLLSKKKSRADGQRPANSKKRRSLPEVLARKKEEDLENRPVEGEKAGFESIPGNPKESEKPEQDQETEAGNDKEENVKEDDFNLDDIQMFAKSKSEQMEEQAKPKKEAIKESEQDQDLSGKKTENHADNDLDR